MKLNRKNKLLHKVAFTILIVFLVTLVNAQQTDKEIWRENYDKALPFYNSRDYISALPYSEAAYKVAQKTYTNADLEFEYSVYLLGIIYQNLNRNEEALSLMQLDLQIVEKSFGKNHSKYGTRLNNLATLYMKMGDYQKALPISLEALENTEKNLGKNHPYYGAYLYSIVNLYRSMGEYAKALPLCIEVLETAEKNLGKNHSDYSIVLNGLAQLYESMGEYAKALPLYQEALENTAKSLGKNHSNYGIGLSNLAHLYESIGEYTKALPLYIEALENTEKSLGKNHSGYGVSLNNLANLYQAMGAYSKALSLYLEALDNTEKSLGKNHLYYSIHVNGLAHLYESMGEYAKALPLYIEALENAEKSIGKEHPDYGIRLNNLANLYKATGNYAKALTLYIEALENTEKSLGKEHSYYGIYLSNLAGLYKNMGDYAKALPLAIEALKNTEKSLGKNHPEYGTRLGGLAGLYEAIGAYAKAFPLYLEALENTEKCLGKNHSNYAIHLNNLAGQYKSMGENAKALPLYLEANQNLTIQIEEIFSFRSEKEKKAFLETVLFNFDALQSFGFTTQNTVDVLNETNLNNQLLLKGLLLNSSKNVIEKLLALNDAVINTDIDNFRANKTQLTQQQSLRIAERSINTDSLSTKINTQEVALVKTYNEKFGKTNTLTKDWNVIKRQLKPNELAIEFSRFDYFNKKWTDSSMYVAYLYKKDWKTPKVVNLFEEKQLAKYFSEKTNPNTLYASRGSSATSTQAKLSVSDSIYNLVWKPLEPYTKASSNIYFSPDGLLHKIPFAALPNEEHKLISELYQINQMGNTADIRKNEQLPNLDDMLLIGGIKYEYVVDNTKQKKDDLYSVLESENLLGNEKNRSISRDGFNYLEGTKEEIDAIATIFNNTKQLSGYNATETAFKQLSGKSPSVLHIATHGFFFKKPEDAQKRETLTAQSNSYKDSDDPLLRAGLLFANANYAWQNGSNPYEDDDGVLTALEISNMDLKHTDIVILSACETGLGEIEGSEGVFGLQRAFKMAGVKTIVMSLWEVPDAETAEFMNLFYTKWEKLKNPKIAFKEAQQQMMHKYRDTPEKWAAFVLVE